METFWKAAQTKIAVTIYSKPRFVFETLFISIVCIVFLIVCTNFKRYYCRNKTANKCAQSLEEIALQSSPSSSTTDSFCSNLACAGSCHNLTSTISSLSSEKYACVTFDEFLQQSPVKSLRNLCNETLERKSSELAVRRHLEMAKEHLQLAKSCLGCLGSGDHKPIVKVTDSLFELMKRIILNSCDRKQLPFRGDMAALAAEIVELSLDVR